MTDDRTIRETMAELGITISDLSRKSGVDPSHLRKQIGGDMHLQNSVKKAFVDALDERAIAALPHVARLLREHGEPEAADACERIWDELSQPKDQPSS